MTERKHSRTWRDLVSVAKGKRDGRYTAHFAFPQYPFWAEGATEAEAIERLFSQVSAAGALLDDIANNVYDPHPDALNMIKARVRDIFNADGCPK